MNETLKVISRRRSIRAYKAEQITDTELHEVLEAALLAPNAANGQKWHFTVVQNKDLLDRMVDDIIDAVKNSGNTFLLSVVSRPNHHTFYHAPTVIIISGAESSPYSQCDCSASAENILIAAESLNIGSCWIETFLPLFDSEKGNDYKKELGIPEGCSPICAIALGYKATDNVPVPFRRKDVINFVK